MDGQLCWSGCVAETERGVAEGEERLEVEKKGEERRLKSLR